MRPTHAQKPPKANTLDQLARLAAAEGEREARTHGPTDPPAQLPWSPLIRTREVPGAYSERPAQVWSNSRYVVIAEEVALAEDAPAAAPRLMHLSIRRHDRGALHDWRDLQRIKNEIVGDECEGLEIYPAESRLADTANQYHLWVFMDPAFTLGIGLGPERLIAEGGSDFGSVQRPWAPEDRPADCKTPAEMSARLREDANHNPRIAAALDDAKRTD